MKPNVDNIQKLIDIDFDGNKSAFARSIGVERSQISALMNHGGSVGSKFYGGLISYCDLHELDFIGKHYENLIYTCSKIAASSDFRTCIN